MALGDELFTGVASINDYLLMSNLENNIKSFLDWGFLNIGGFINVSTGSNSYNNNPSRLGIVSDPNYSDGQVWQTQHQNWIWESGVDFNGSSPTLISGVNVDGNPVGSGYTIDYINSRIIFDSPISPSSTVEMNYSYRWVQVHQSVSNLVWWKQFQFDIVNDPTQFNTNTGEYAVFTQNRIQLPAIVIEMVPRGTSKPYQLGDKSLICDQDIILHIIANNAGNRNSILDIIRLQEDKVIWLYDTNQLISEGVMPFNFDGSLNGSALSYNKIVQDCEEEPDPITNKIECDDTYRWKTCRLKDFIVSEVESRYFFAEAKIRITAEIIFDTIG